MSSIPPHIAIAYQPKSVCKPIKRITPAVNQFIPDPVMASQAPLPSQPQPELTDKEIDCVFLEESHLDDYGNHFMELEQFRVAARAVIAAEREACARICDKQYERARTSTGAARADACATAIRSRRPTTPPEAR